jgi:hypothetical protein
VRFGRTFAAAVDPAKLVGVARYTTLEGPSSDKLLSELGMLRKR